MDKKYRQCAGVVVFNAEGKVLLGNRVKFKNAWQFPQGGIETGESVIDAAKRELREETSVTSVALVYSEKKSIRYTFNNQIKEKFRKKGILTDGQDIYFSLFYFTGNEDEINLKTEVPEFDEYKWESLDFAIKNVIFFKKNAYMKIAKKFQPIINKFLDTKKNS